MPLAFPAALLIKDAFGIATAFGQTYTTASMWLWRPHKVLHSSLPTNVF
jgi:hypothetical protein